MYDTIIIGAGPAGLTAAIYLRRANKNVLVLEAKSYGGQIINTLEIENYPACPKISGFDFATNLYEQAKELGAEIKFSKVLDIKPYKIKKIITNNGEYLCRSVIIATGCENRKLGILNENQFIGRGISYCATCDGNFYKNKVVAVVGGGNTAIDDSLYLSNIARKVYVIHRRDTFRADAKTLSLLKDKDNVTFILNSNVTKLSGNNHLESIEITNHNAQNKTLNIDGLFIAIGQKPLNESFSKIIKLDDLGYVKSRGVKTNRQGIFVAGDVRKKNVRQLVTATSDGAEAAVMAISFLNNK